LSIDLQGDRNAESDEDTTRAVSASPALATVLASQERTAAWLARRTGKSPSYVTRVLNGERRPSDHFKAAAAAALNVPVSLLFPEAVG
jgi:hypothetical protein